MADVEVSYKGSTIGSLSASGTLTLETEGKYCEDDIEVVYVSPGGGGYVTQDANGYIVLPSTGGGGSSVQTETGTFTGDGGVSASISCSFAPDLIFIYGSLSGDPSLRGINALTIIKNTEMVLIGDGSSSSYSPTLVSARLSDMTDYNADNYETDAYATYSSGTLTVYGLNQSSGKFSSGVTYTYKLVGWS